MYKTIIYILYIYNIIARTLSWLSDEFGKEASGTRKKDTTPVSAFSADTRRVDGSKKNPTTMKSLAASVAKVDFQPSVVVAMPRVLQDTSDGDDGATDNPDIYGMDTRGRVRSDLEAWDDTIVDGGGKQKKRKDVADRMFLGAGEGSKDGSKTTRWGAEVIPEPQYASSRRSSQMSSEVQLFMLDKRKKEQVYIYIYIYIYIYACEIAD